MRDTDCNKASVVSGKHVLLYKTVLHDVADSKRADS